MAHDSADRPAMEAARGWAGAALAHKGAGLLNQAQHSSPLDSIEGVQNIIAVKHG